MFAEIFGKKFGKIEVFIRKEIIMKKGILNEVNEIHRVMGLVNEQNDSIMDMLSSAFDNMNLGGVIDSISDFDIDGIIEAISELDYDLIYDELSKLPKPVSEKLIDYIIEYVDKFSIPGIVGIVDKNQLIDIKNKLMSMWNESSINEQSNNQNKEEVLKIQKALNKVWNNVKIKEDGIMSNETIKYIKQFQEENNLEVNGIVGPETGKKLFRLLNDNTSNKNEKERLIQIFRNHLESMEEDDRFDSMSVAKVMYNDAAHYMNKTGIFSSREGEPISRKVPFAPEN